MRVLTSFATLCVISSAVAIGKEPAANIIPYNDDPIANYSYQKHVRSNGGKANFNKQVYHFDEQENIFDQKEYEARIEAEAELMIALESIKTSIVFM